MCCCCMTAGGEFLCMECLLDPVRVSPRGLLAGVWWVAACGFHTSFGVLHQRPFGVHVGYVCTRVDVAAVAQYGIMHASVLVRMVAFDGFLPVWWCFSCGSGCTVGPTEAALLGFRHVLLNRGGTAQWGPGHCQASAAVAGVLYAALASYYVFTCNVLRVSAHRCVACFGLAVDVWQLQVLYVA